MLGPLANNGGPTQTMAIPASSPAYDANAQCSGTDQSGVSLLQRGATQCDIGAYQVSAPTTYVANPPAASVNAYATGATGDASPVLALGGASTGLNQPTGVVADVNGNVFVANAGGNSITRYAPEVSGNVAPVATIGGARTRLNKPQDVALDGNGDVWVANAAGAVTEYAAGARGNVAPIARIAGSLTKLSRPRGLVFDPSGDLRVTNANGTVTTYSASANGNVAPLSRLVHGTANRLSTDLQGLNFDGAGNLVLADAGGGRVDGFAGSASGVAKPVSTLTGTPSLQTPTGLDLDVFGNVFVADSAANSVDQFVAGSSGGAQPSAVISGPATGLASPAFLSELPPPPVPGLHASISKRRSRKSLLRNGILLTLTAWGKRAFRGEPVKVGVVVRARGRTFATAKALPLRPGKVRIRLLQTRRAPQLLRRHHKTKVKVTVTIRGGFGAKRHRLTITSTG